MYKPSPRLKANTSSVQRVVVYFSYWLQEYSVYLEKDANNNDSHYYTDDKEDAIATAECMLESANIGFVDPSLNIIHRRSNSL